MQNFARLFSWSFSRLKEWKFAFFAEMWFLKKENRSNSKFVSELQEFELWIKKWKTNYKPPTLVGSILIWFRAKIHFSTSPLWTHNFVWYKYLLLMSSWASLDAIVQLVHIYCCWILADCWEMKKSPSFCHISEINFAFHLDLESSSSNNFELKLQVMMFMFLLFAVRQWIIRIMKNSTIENWGIKFNLFTVLHVLWCSSIHCTSPEGLTYTQE